MAWPSPDQPLTPEFVVLYVLPYLMPMQFYEKYAGDRVLVNLLIFMENVRVTPVGLLFLVLGKNSWGIMP